MTDNNSPLADPFDGSAPPSRMLLEGYLAGELSDKDAEHVRAWIDADVVRKAYAEGLKGRVANSQVEPARVDALWRQLITRVEGAPAQVPAVLVRRGVGAWNAVGRGRRGLRTRTVQQQIWSVMTGLAVGILGIVVGWNWHIRHMVEQPALAMSTYTTSNGERATIKLADGSTVALNVGSRLDVPVDYATGRHTVRLLGEALFTVSQHESVPFTVVAGGKVIRVLGTSFVVRHYATDTTATVTVQDGKVAVGSTIVTAARMLEIGPHGTIRERPADVAQFGFVNGVLYLPSIPLSQAATELERWYAAEIRFGDPSLAQIPIEGEFTAGSITDLANHLGWILNARVVRNGRVLTLFPREK